jgi:hypothetical protein
MIIYLEIQLKIFFGLKFHFNGFEKFKNEEFFD